MTNYEGWFLKWIGRYLKKYAIRVIFLSIFSQIFFSPSVKDQVNEVVCIAFRRSSERILLPRKYKTIGILFGFASGRILWLCSYLFTVLLECFDPPPRVKFRSVRLVRNNPSKNWIVRKTVKQVVSWFWNRRKTLRNCFEAIYFAKQVQITHPILTSEPERYDCRCFRFLTKLSSCSWKSCKQFECPNHTWKSSKWLSEAGRLGIHSGVLRSWGDWGCGSLLEEFRSIESLYDWFEKYSTQQSADILLSWEDDTLAKVLKWNAKAWDGTLHRDDGFPMMGADISNLCKDEIVKTH